MKYVLGILGFVILTVLAVVLLASTTASRTDGNQEGEKVVNLADYIDNGSVTYTTQGEIVGNEDYTALRITVRPNERRIQLISGYTGTVQREQSYPNNAQAFDAFMRSLANGGYTRERKTTNKDMRGVCPLGLRYVYQLQEQGSDVTSLWSTSCTSREGTFGGDDDLIGRLFENQIPQYEEFTEGIDL